MTCARCGSEGFGCYECTPDPCAIIARLTAERDAALAQVAGASDPHAIWAAMDSIHDSDTTLDDYATAVSRAIRALTPAAAKAALDRIKRQARIEGLQQAYDLSGGYHQVTHIRAAILAAIKGEELL